MPKTNDKDVAKIELHLAEIMKLLGIAKTPSNEETPRRIAEMWVNELFKNRNELPNHSVMTTFENKGTKELITLNHIKFTSVCEHHWLPFYGEARIGYVPEQCILGLSKFPRVVKFFSQKPQVQEELTNEIGDYLVSILHPRFLAVELNARHECVMCRGAENNCDTKTIYVHRTAYTSIERQDAFEMQFRMNAEDWGDTNYA